LKWTEKWLINVLYFIIGIIAVLSIAWTLFVNPSGKMNSVSERINTESHKSLIGAAGVSAVPNCSRVVQIEGLRADLTNHLRACYEIQCVWSYLISNCCWYSSGIPWIVLNVTKKALFELLIFFRDVSEDV